VDRFARGLVAGIIGGIVMNIWSVMAVYIFGWEIIRFVDWAGIILYGDMPRSHLEGIMALVLQLLWSGLLGIGLAFLIQQVTSREYLIKAVFFGVMVGFIVYAIPVMFKMPYLSQKSLVTVASNHIGGAIWGLTSGLVLRWLDSSPRVHA